MKEGFITMEKQLHEMTYNQYYQWRIDGMAKEYELTKVECMDFYPLDMPQLKQEYGEAIEKAASTGNIIPNLILDKLSDTFRYHILHDYNRNGEYNGYIIPEARKINEEQGKYYKRPVGRPKKVS